MEGETGCDPPSSRLPCRGHGARRRVGQHVCPHVQCHVGVLRASPPARGSGSCACACGLCCPGSGVTWAGPGGSSVPTAPSCPPPVDDPAGPRLPRPQLAGGAGGTPRPWRPPEAQQSPGRQLVARPVLACPRGSGAGSRRRARPLPAAIFPGRWGVLKLACDAAVVLQWALVRFPAPRQPVTGLRARPGPHARAAGPPSALRPPRAPVDFPARGR